MSVTTWLQCRVFKRHGALYYSGPSASVNSRIEKFTLEITLRSGALVCSRCGATVIVVPGPDVTQK